MLMWYIAFMYLYMWNIHAPLKRILGHKMMSYSGIWFANILFYYYLINFTHQTQLLLSLRFLLPPPHPPTSFHSKRLGVPWESTKPSISSCGRTKTLPLHKGWTWHPNIENRLQKASSCTSVRSWSHYHC